MEAPSTTPPRPDTNDTHPGVRIIDGLEELGTLVGQVLGTSPWIEVDQLRINNFAEATDDYQWIHVDLERAAKESPTGGTIAHGFLILSLIPTLIEQIFRIEGLTRILNYGFNKVRFADMVPSGSRMRMKCTLKDMHERNGAALTTIELRFEVEGAKKPVCIAEMLNWIYTD